MRLTIGVVVDRFDHSHAGSLPHRHQRRQHRHYDAQEALTNIERHAQANKIELELQAETTSIRLVVCDNGQGFSLDDAEKSDRYGLRGMRERADLVDGELQVESVPGNGTKLEFFVSEILLCDDQEIARQGLSMILGSVDDLKVVGQASNGEEALRLVESLSPHVVLMDLKMPIMNGAQATKLIRQRFPDVQVLVLTTYDDDEWLFDAIRAGASGYLLKDTRPADLLAAIRNVAAGKSPVDPSVAGKLMQSVNQQATPLNPAFADLLTQREIEILRYMAQGLSNAEIGEKVYLSEGTVRNMISPLFSKLGVTDRTQAVVAAIRHGLIKVNEL